MATLRRAWLPHHRLPVAFRIDLKIQLITYKAQRACRTLMDKSDGALAVVAPTLWYVRHQEITAAKLCLIF